MHMNRLNTTVDQLQQRFDTLTPATRISKSLKKFVSTGNTNPDEIIAMIRLEPLLAARFIRSANQLKGAREEGYASIEDAITAIGFQPMHDLLSAYANHCNDGIGRTTSYSTEQWKRSVTTAACMESLANKQGFDAHAAYSIGLLHSLAPAIDEAHGIISCSPEISEDRFSKLSHRLSIYGRAGLSQALFSSWNFPAIFSDAVRFQYTPLECKTDGKFLACLLNLSKWITGVIRESDELPEQSHGPDVLVLNLLDEGEHTLWNLVSDVSDGLHKADSILEGDFYV